MQVQVANISDIPALGEFLCKMNNDKTSHVGYCGTDLREIVMALQEDFVREDGELSFVVVKNDSGQIQAAVGFDIDGSSAEVWGPFNSSSEEYQNRLWEKAIKEHREIKKYYFFLNESNVRQRAFLEDLGAKNTGEHLILVINKSQIHHLHDKQLVDFRDNDMVTFEKLHKEVFPDTYYDAGEIVSRLNKGNKLKLLKGDDNELQGYAHYEVNSDFSEASLEYIAVSPHFRNKGLGTILLQEVLEDIFSYENIEEIKLCVSNRNKSANGMYVKAGFEKRDLLISYSLKIN